MSVSLWTLSVFQCHSFQSILMKLCTIILSQPENQDQLRHRLQNPIVHFPDLSPLLWWSENDSNEYRERIVASQSRFICTCGLFWPRSQICKGTIGYIWYHNKCFNDFVARSVCYWWRPGLENRFWKLGFSVFKNPKISKVQILRFKVFFYRAMLAQSAVMRQ